MSQSTNINENQEKNTTHHLFILRYEILSYPVTMDMFSSEVLKP